MSCPYSHTLCTPEEPCAYCERNMLRALVREMGKAIQYVLSPEFYAKSGVRRRILLEEILNRPEVKAIMEGK